MNLHANARTCPKSRALIVTRVLEEGWTLLAAAEAAGCSVRTAAKWLARSKAGDERLADRSSRPHGSPCLFGGGTWNACSQSGVFHLARPMRRAGVHV